jgi:hypothetical protein
LIVFEYLPNSSLDKHIYGNAMMNGWLISHKSSLTSVLCMPFL